MAASVRTGAVCAIVVAALACLAGCGGGSGPTETGTTISGQLVDAANPGQPISNAYVYVPVPGASSRQSGGRLAETYSGADGTYTLTGVPAGAQTVVVEPPSGFATIRVTLDLEAGTAVAIRITVLPTASNDAVRSIEITPPGAVVAAGTTRTFEARAYDAAHQELSLAPTWHCPPRLGAITPQGAFTAGTQPVSGSVTAVIGPVSASASVRVVTGPPAGGPAQGQWAMFRCEPRRTGRCPADGPDNGVLAWRYDAGDWVVSSPAVGPNGRIYVGTVANKLLALNPDGSLAWEFAVDNVVNSSPALAEDGTVYVGGGKGTAYALFAVRGDGSEKWVYPMNANPGRCSPLVGPDGRVYLGGMNLLTHAIDPDGAAAWQFRAGNWSQSSPALGVDGSVYVSSWDDRLYALKPDGTQRWAYTMGGDSYSTPAVGDDGTIYVGSNDHCLHAVYPNGTRRWVYRTDGEIRSSPAIAPDGTIIVGSGDGKVHAVRPDGTQRWSFAAGVRVDSSPAVDANGDVYVGAWDGTFYALGADGTEKWRYATGNRIESSPAIAADGTVYVGSHDNHLYAFREATP